MERVEDLHPHLRSRSHLQVSTALCGRTWPSWLRAGPHSARPSRWRWFRARVRDRDRVRARVKVGGWVRVRIRVRV